MAKQYDNTDSGVLFKNEEKATDKHPDYRGKINVGGSNYWLSAWLKTDKNGNKYMSLSVQPMEQKGRAPSAPRKQEVDSDIPF